MWSLNSKLLKFHKIMEFKQQKRPNLADEWNIVLSFLNTRDRLHVSAASSDFEHIHCRKPLCDRWNILPADDQHKENLNTYFGHHLKTHETGGIMSIHDTTILSARTTQMMKHHCKTLFAYNFDLCDTPLKYLREFETLELADSQLIKLLAESCLLESLVVWDYIPQSDRSLCPATRVGWISDCDIDVLQCFPNAETVGIVMSPEVGLTLDEQYKKLLQQFGPRVRTVIIGLDTFYNLDYKSWSRSFRQYAPHTVHTFYFWFDDCTFVDDESSVSFLKNAMGLVPYKVHLIRDDTDRTFDYRSCFPFLGPCSVKTVTIN